MSHERKREILKFEGLFAPRSPFEFVGFCIAIIMLNWLSQLPQEILPDFLVDALSIFFVVAVFAIWWFFDRRRIRKRALLLTFQPSKEQPSAARGLILLLSPYDPRDPALKDERKLRPLIEHIKNTPDEGLKEIDFNKINVLNSNLRPQIKAVEYHLGRGTLQEIWLITSESYDNVKGSEDAAFILEKYLQFKYKDKQLKVHREGLSAKEWDYRRLWELGEKIFRESSFKEEVLLADITGGTKMMSVALAMACIPPGRRMQYVYSERDWQGNPLPLGAIDPVVIDVDPILYSVE